MICWNHDLQSDVSGGHGVRNLARFVAAVSQGHRLFAHPETRQLFLETLKEQIPESTLTVSPCVYLDPGMVYAVNWGLFIVDDDEYPPPA